MTDEVLVIGEGLGLFLVDDGVDHWVIASDGVDALVVVKEHYGEGALEQWVDEPPELTRLTVATASSRKFVGDDGDTTMLVEAQRDPVRRYVACSEF